MIQTVKKIEKKVMKSSCFNFTRFALGRHMKIDIGENDVSKTHSIIVGSGIASAAIFFIIQGVVL